MILSDLVISLRLTAYIAILIITVLLSLKTTFFIVFLDKKILFIYYMTRFINLVIWYMKDVTKWQRASAIEKR